MSLLTKSRGKFAAVAVAAGLALGGVMFSSPAYASPEDPVAPANLTINGDATYYEESYSEWPSVGPDSLPIIEMNGSTANFSGTGEPGMTVRIGYMTDLDGSSESVHYVFTVVGTDGNWTVEGPIASGMILVDIGQYAEDLATVQADCEGLIDWRCRTIDYVNTNGNFFAHIVEADLPVPVIAPLVGGAAALAGLVGAGAYAVRRKQND